MHVNAAIIIQEEKKEVKEISNVTVNETITPNTTSNESLRNETQSNKTQENSTVLVLKNETESKEEPIERGAKIKFNNYFEYAIGTGNSS